MQSFYRSQLETIAVAWRGYHGGFSIVQRRNGARPDCTRCSHIPIGRGMSLIPVYNGYCANMSFR